MSDTPLYSDVDLPPERLLEWRRTLLKRWAKSAMRFLTAIDPTTRRSDGRPSYVWITTDEREKDNLGANTEKPFPSWAYLAQMFALYNRHDMVGIEKSRQVFATTGTLAYAFHLGAFHKNQKIQLSKATQPEADELLYEKIRVPHSRMPPWLQQALEITPTPANRIRFRSTSVPRWPSTGSSISAVAQNAAVRGFRGGTSSLTIIDEAALQNNLSAMLRAAAPMAARVICLTSADGSEAGGEAFVKYFDCSDDRRKHLKPLAIPVDDFDESAEYDVSLEDRMKDEAFLSQAMESL